MALSRPTLPVAVSPDALPDALPAEDFRAAWHRALLDLELEVDHAEALLLAQHDDQEQPSRPAWSAPVIAALLPEDLRDRAERLLDRQLTVAGRLAAAMTSSRRQLAVVDRLVPGDARPMYVDQSL